MRSVPMQFVVYLIGWVLWRMEYCLSCLLAWIHGKVARIFEAAGNIDAAGILDPPAFEEGNILIHDIEQGSWVVLRYTPGEGYLLSDDQGCQKVVPKWDVEIFYYRPSTQSHQKRRRGH